MTVNAPIRLPLQKRVGRHIGASPDFSPAAQFAIGVAAALAAVGVRYGLPLLPHQLPTLPLVITLAIVTTFIGAQAGTWTALLGGVLSWYLFFNPSSWSLSGDAWIPLLGYAVLATVIVSTAKLYRTSARLHHERQIAELETKANASELFAREMAHRLKNSLSIVQSIAFQTVGADGQVAERFAGRLKALADANDLLSEHVESPTGNARHIIETALKPFDASRVTIRREGVPLASQQAVSLALAIHELATNATKYGALSRSSGSVTIDLASGPDSYEMLWEEKGGPSVEQPNQRGFGSRLLKRAGLKTDLDFAPTGLRCRLALRAGAWPNSDSSDR